MGSVTNSDILAQIKSMEATMATKKDVQELKEILNQGKLLRA